MDLLQPPVDIEEPTKIHGLHPKLACDVRNLGLFLHVLTLLQRNPGLVRHYDRPLDLGHGNQPGIRLAL